MALLSEELVFSCPKLIKAANLLVPRPLPGQCLKYCTWHNLCSRQKLVYQTAGDGRRTLLLNSTTQRTEKRKKNNHGEDGRLFEAGIRQRGQRQAKLSGREQTSSATVSLCACAWMCVCVCVNV